MNKSWNRACTTVYEWRHLMKATEAGLAERNGSLPPGGWLKVTCWLTACTLGSAPGPTLGSEYRSTSSFFNLGTDHVHPWLQNHPEPPPRTIVQPYLPAGADVHAHLMHDFLGLPHSRLLTFSARHKIMFD